MRHWRTLLGIALSAALLYWAFRDIHFGEVRRELASANLLLFMAAAGIATLTFPIRAMRWQVILEPVEANIPFGPLWRATAIGMMINNVAPARLGEPARAYALSRETRVPFTTAFASLAVDRLFDALVIVMLFCVALLDPAFPSQARLGDQPIANWAGGAILLILLLVGTLYLVVLLPSRVIGLYEAFARRVAPSLEARGRDALLAFAAGLGILRRPSRFAAVLAWTTVHWLVGALAFWVGFQAVGIDAPASAALFVQGVVAFGVAAPSAPGFVGVFEAAAKAGLAVYGVSGTQALSWAIGYHVLGFIPITVIGIWYFMRLGLRLSDVRRASNDEVATPGASPPGDAPGGFPSASGTSSPRGR